MHCCSGCTDYVRLFLDLDRPELKEGQTWNYELCGNASAPVQTTYYSSNRCLVLEFHSSPMQRYHAGFNATFRFFDKCKSCEERSDPEIIYGAQKDSRRILINLMYTEVPRPPFPYQKCVVGIEVGQGYSIHFFGKSVDFSVYFFCTKNDQRFKYRGFIYYLMLCNLAYLENAAVSHSKTFL